jgi:hypothetical protein
MLSSEATGRTRKAASQSVAGARRMWLAGASSPRMSQEKRRLRAL